MKSEESMGKLINFREDNSSADLRLDQDKRSDSPEPSCVSMKSDRSMGNPINFREDNSSADLRVQKETPEISRRNMDSILKELEHKVISLVKNQLKRFVKVLKNLDYPACSGKEEEDEEDQSGVREGALKITLHVLRNMNQTDLANKLQTKLAPSCHRKLKSTLKGKFEKINEGMTNPETSVLLNQIYTELYITQGGGGEINQEHEVRQIEDASRKRTTQEIPIKCNDIFKPLPEQNRSIRTVLTKGVAGIGKTVSVQKFILDWAEGKVNQDVLFIFPLPFRELNLMKEKKLSLVNLLQRFFPETQDLKPRHYKSYKIMFIFDGLDECRLPLDFQNNENLVDIEEQTSVDVLLTNLIKKNLLPSALLWITTRPAAANQIPPDCIDQVTEVRGFRDPQKEEYFRKRIRDQSLAERIITHMKSSRSLYIMCHIPVFCWISATVLERMLGEAEGGEIPKTLTQMFTHFLIFQIKHRSQKYHHNSEDDLKQTRKIILALGKLAFQQLEKGNLIFYEEDLKECSIDVKEVFVYSGVCTQIFRQESELHLGKVFSFVHLSVQEFLAALYAFLSFISNNRNVLPGVLDFSKKETMSDFLKRAVDEALKSKNGHLDLFLRFLLGLSLESNQTLLRGLLIQTGSISHSKEEVVEHIKQKIEENLSPDKTISLFHCLNELNDHSLVQQVQQYLNRGGGSRGGGSRGRGSRGRGSRGLSGAKLSPAEWSAVAFVMLNSEEDLDEFDLSKFQKSEECLLRLLPVVKTSRKIVVYDCSITEKGCSALFSVLKLNPSHLRELSLAYSKPGDSGVKLLSDLLMDPLCKLETLQLEFCSITEKHCADLVSALKSNPSELRELNLSYNKPGVKMISGLLEDPRCKLEKLQLEFCRITGEDCAALVSALKLNPSHLRELNLNYNKPGDSGVKLLSDLLKDPHFKLEKLQICDSSELRELNLNDKNLGDSGMKLLSDLLADPHCNLEKLQLGWCSITGEDCAALVSALKLNPSHLRELNLNYNDPGDSGVKLLSHLLKDPHFKLEKLQLEDCSITGEGCAALVSALKLNPSHLRELNLNDNNPGDSGVKLLSDLLKDPHFKLEKLQLEDCSITGEDCAALVSALKLNPSHLRELNLSSNNPGDSGVKLLSDLLKDPHFKLEKLQLEDCSITGEDCAALVSALKLNPSHLRELNLNLNNPGDSGVKLLSDLLKDSRCKLEKLELVWCSITGDGCAALVSALKLNPSHLRELNLNYNNPGDSGVKLLSDLLKDPHFKLENLQLMNCSITGEGCAALVSALKLNPSHLRELNLNHNNPGDSGVKLLSDLLKDPHCKLEKLQLKFCGITENHCAALVSAMKSNPSELRELNLSYNKPVVKMISGLLEDPRCKLEKLQLEFCRITGEDCATLVSALKLNPSHLRELNLNYNNPGDSGVKLLSDLLKDHHFKLEKLKICDSSELRELNLGVINLGDSGVKLLSDLLEDPYCNLEKLHLRNSSLTGEDCAALVSALKLNPSHLRELNLSYNNPGDSGVKLLSDLLTDPHFNLENLQLWDCNLSEKSCAALASALSSNSSSLRELDLGKNELQDSGVKLLSAGLKSSHCKLQKLELMGCSITGEGCAALVSALKLNPSHLRELYLNHNKPGDSGVKLLSDLLKDPHFKLENLQLEYCSITEEGCAALLSALKLNPSYLRELNLSNSKPGDSGVKLLSDLLKDPHFKLQKLKLWRCDLSDNNCATLASALSSNSSSLRELNLGFNKLQDSGVKLLCAGLKSSHCKLQELELVSCRITGEGCAALVSALKLNPSHLRELDLNFNNPGDSGVKLLSDLLKDPHFKLEKLKI
ncbi:NLR family CARD domain-containing protein 3-like [Astyanax mexicanus]|uniref:NLR family CARD domain-containing protein 3-like n=1 Tax=Astyanax mexicanus TaxID=7994 RepID=UPI0020CB53FC|nr:NLR family CARD domain-containing protein 3-like [Astyanax mexicanus]